MEGFAVVDAKAGGEAIAVWLVSRTDSLEVSNTNAVVLEGPLHGAEVVKFRQLVSGRVVLLTEESQGDELPLLLPGHPAEALQELEAQTWKRRTQVVAAVREYASRPNPVTGKKPAKPRKLVAPNFVDSPVVTEAYDAELPELRALALANRVRGAWQAWLAADEERRRRSSPLRGQGRPIMPTGLDSPELSEVPPELVGKFRVQPVSTEADANS